MNNTSTEILQHLVRTRATREERLTDLLKPPDEDMSGQWFACVPSCFNAALDISQTQRVTNGQKQLVWTQGSAFAFKKGDILYDSKSGYQEWSVALRTMKTCIQIKEAKDASPAHDDTSRNPGFVSFSILEPTRSRDNVVEVSRHDMTQDQFVNFLITGER